jgi:hypothetical protein
MRRYIVQANPLVGPNDSTVGIHSAFELRKAIGCAQYNTVIIERKFISQAKLAEGLLSDVLL